MVFTFYYWLPSCFCQIFQFLKISSATLIMHWLFVELMYPTSVLFCHFIDIYDSFTWFCNFVDNVAWEGNICSYLAQSINETHWERQVKESRPSKLPSNKTVVKELNWLALLLSIWFLKPFQAFLRMLILKINHNGLWIGRRKIIYLMLWCSNRHQSQVRIEFYIPIKSHL